MLNQQPDNPALLLNRLRANILAGQAELAIADGERLVAMDAHNEVYRFYLQVARGETPPTQPEAVISELFNAYAAHYDELMLRTHRVPIPGAVAKMILEWHPLKDADILDLGCGTGLLGAFLGRNQGVHCGSGFVNGQMLAVANQRRVYDRLHSVNLLDCAFGDACGPLPRHHLAGCR
jgi:predicted TPR repeat methyltransferase